MKKYTQEFLDSIYNNITVQWIMDNPVAVELLIKDLIQDVIGISEDITMENIAAMLNDDLFYEQELKEVNKYEYEVEDYYKLKHNK